MGIVDVQQSAWVRVPVGILSAEWLPSPAVELRRGDQRCWQGEKDDCNKSDTRWQYLQHIYDRAE